MTANVSPELTAMAYMIADGAARDTIRSCCPWHDGDGVRWWDWDMCSECDRLFVCQAREYLLGRGVLLPHPTNIALVRFKGKGGK